MKNLESNDKSCHVDFENLFIFVTRFYALRYIVSKYDVSRVSDISLNLSFFLFLSFYANVAGSLATARLRKQLA